MLRKTDIILRLFLPLILVLAAVFPAAADKDADSARTEISRAREQYEAGRYREAINIYTALLDKYGNSPQLLFDLGNAYTKIHDYGNAMLCYERARVFEPSDERIANNILYVTQQVEAQNRSDLKGQPMSVTPDEPWFFRSIYNNIAIDTKSDTWALFAAIAFILFIFFVADYIFTKGVLLRKFGFFGGLCMLGCSIIFIIFAFCASDEAATHDEAVITAEKIELLSEPSDNAKTCTTYLNRGTKVDIVKTEGGTYEHPQWYDVRLNSNFAGWIKAENIEVI